MASHGGLIAEMRVLLDTTFALRGFSGTAVYLTELRTALEAAGVDVVPAANEGRGAPGRGGLRSARNLRADRRWTGDRLAELARAARADVIHHPLPAHCARAPCPQVVTVHDLAFTAHPELFSRRFRLWAARAHRVAAQRADAVVCVSLTTRDAVGEQWGVPAERLVVAPHGPGQRLPAVARAATPRHLLYVGDAELRKRVDVLRDAHGLLRERDGQAPPLVLAGSGHARGPGVVIVEHPDAARLARLYADAFALVHPSVHEGFGLTLLEAMATGTPVLAAASQAAREVCGDAAVLLADPDPAALARELSRLCNDAPRRASLSAGGIARSAAFSWARSAREHMRAYTLALR